MVPDMLWDKIDLEAVEIQSEKRSLALALTSCNELIGQLTSAMDLAGLDLVAVDHEETCLTAITRNKPDIVFADERLIENTTNFQDRVLLARVTESLPILPIKRVKLDEMSSLGINLQSPVIEIFLKARALLRMERPSALTSKRLRGAFVLDEPRFKLCFQDKSADLSKAELCLIGPFFDVGYGVLDRTLIEQLALSDDADKFVDRIVDFKISRMRRRLKVQLGIDPLQSVRGIGYALANI